MPRVSNKKCIPGLFCMENMTMFLLFVLIITVIYMYYTHLVKPNLKNQSNASFSQPVIIMPAQNKDVAPVTLAPISSRTQPLEDIYSPPLKKEGPGLPINISTRGPETSYTQVGILTRENSHEDLILPLMGRRTPTARDKWQYYTVAGGGAGGNLQTKLPVRVKGRSCSGEYGCDEIYNRDNVFVEGYQDEFVATIYESGLFSYLPL